MATTRTGRSKDVLLRQENAGRREWERRRMRGTLGDTGPAGPVGPAGADGATGPTGPTYNAFGTVAVSGQSDVVADAGPDTLTLVAGTNVTITTDAGTDSITINASGGAAISGTDERIVRVDGTTALQDNSQWVIKDAGEMLYGIATARTINTIVSPLQIEGTGDGVGISTVRTAIDSNANLWRAWKSRGGVGALAANDTVLNIQAWGTEGAAEYRLGQIRFLVDATPSAGIVPGVISFDVSDATTGTITQVMRVTSDLQVAFVGHTTAQPVIATSNDLDTGIDLPAGNTVNIVSGGVLQAHTNVLGLFADRAFHEAITPAGSYITTNTALDSSHGTMIVDTTSGSVTITVPTAVSKQGRKYKVVKAVAANSVIIDPTGAETIGGAATFTLSLAGESITFQSDNANWIIT